MEDALVNFVVTGKLRFSDLVDSILADLARIAIRQAFLGALTSGLSSALGGVFGGVFGGARVNPDAIGGPVTPSTTTLGTNPFLARGGLIAGPGGPRSDSILARLSDGEFVVNAAATRTHLPLLEAINQTPSFQQGGAVRVPATSLPAPVATDGGIVVQVIDNRRSGEPVRVSEQRGPDGRRVVRVTVEDIVDGGLRSGRYDGAMFSRYRNRPNLAPR